MTLNLRLTALVVATTLLASGCAVRGLAFVADTRLEIVSPKDNETVTLPFSVTWTMDDYDGRFAVFFDRSPMHPGQDLRSLVPEGDSCRTEPGCPDADWLADRSIYVSDGDRVVIETLPDRRENNRSKDRHDFTIVLLDDDDRRSGESAFTKEFIVERED